MQLLLMALFVRKNGSCQVGWLDAGQTRREITAAWAAAFLQSSTSPAGEEGLATHDLFPNGVERVTRDDVVRLHTQLAAWLDYWSRRFPQDSLKQAMLNLLVRLLQVKKSWLAEPSRSETFPFDDVVSAASSGRLEPYIAGKL